MNVMSVPPGQPCDPGSPASRRASRRRGLADLLLLRRLVGRGLVVALVLLLARSRRLLVALLRGLLIVLLIGHSISFHGT